MKFLKLFLILFIFPLISLASEEPNQMETEIDSVILYLNGAEINRSGEVALKKGRNEIIISRLSTRLDPSSIKAKVGKGVDLLSISSQVTYDGADNPDQNVQSLKDSIELFNQGLTLLQNDKNAYQEEKNMILSNKAIGGANTGVPFEDLKATADFYRTRIKEINDLMTETDIKIKKQHKLLNQLKNNQRALLKKINEEFYEVKMVLKASSPKKTKIQLKYLVSNAVWLPLYNIRAKDIDQPVKLEYRAQVYNDTGVDWKDVHLTLSTADPTRDASKPVMETWELNYTTPYNIGAGRFNTYQYNQSVQKRDKKNKEIYKQEFNEITPAPAPPPSAPPPPVPVPDPINEITVSELSAEFEIEELYDIPADATPYTIDVTEYELPATYQHYTIPKVDKGVFLLAQISGWEDLNLIDGEAGVYYKDTYLGSSRIDVGGVYDTLDLSLGRDPKVVVTRRKLKDKSGKKFLGSNVRETYIYEIAIKNNRKLPISVEIVDQVPLSKEKEIVVDVNNISGAVKDELSGKLTWNFDLKPNEKKTLLIDFVVKYPKGKTVFIKSKRQKISTPRYF